MIRWCTEPGSSGKSISVSDKAEQPWCRLSPDYQHGQIPVPGLDGMSADCVRGTIEGLKLISLKGSPGKINPGFFVGPGRERSLKEGEWMLGYSYMGERVDVSSAVRLIFVPAYTWVLYNKCYDLVANLKKMAERQSEDGQDLWIYDGLPNAYAQHFSAAAVLVEFLNDTFVESPILQ